MVMIQKGAPQIQIILLTFKIGRFKIDMLVKKIIFSLD